MDDFEHAARALDSLGGELDHLTPAELLELGHLATTLIITRIKHGIDVDGRPFKPYSKEYQAARMKRGLSATPDLAVTGHMIGAMLPTVTGADEVTIHFSNPLEAIKAEVHNSGSNSNAVVSAHSRGTHVDKRGRRVSKQEVSRDKRRKTSRLTQRTESVGAHTRKMNTPQREFMDIRRPEEIAMLEESIGKAIGLRVEKTVK